MLNKRDPPPRTLIQKGLPQKLMYNQSEIVVCDATP